MKNRRAKQPSGYTPVRDYPGDNPMDFTKMRNIDGHAFQAADKKVLPVMHHVPELVEKLTAMMMEQHQPSELYPLRPFDAPAQRPRR